MTNLTSFELFRIRLTGILYGLAYFTSQRSFLGMRLSGWLKWLIVIVTAVAWFGQWPRYWVIFGFVLFVVVQLFYWLAKRQGYIRFLAVGKEQHQTGEGALADNKKVKVQATGIFSVSRQQAYVLQKPANYWRVPLGDHAFMVEHEPDKFLYQFVQLGTLRTVETGYLIFGRRPQEALAITFVTTWGPEYGDNSPRQLMAGADYTPPQVERTIYLTFENTADHHLVHQNLLRDAASTTH